MSPMFHSKKQSDRLDIFDFIEYHPDATFFVRYEGDDLLEFSIFKNDILVVDKSIDYIKGKLAVCFCDEFYVTNNPRNDVWGVIKYVIKKV